MALFGPQNPAPAAAGSGNFPYYVVAPGGDYIENWALRPCFKVSLGGTKGASPKSV